MAPAHILQTPLASAATRFARRIGMVMKGMAMKGMAMKGIAIRRMLQTGTSGQHNAGVPLLYLRQRPQPPALAARPGQTTLIVHRHWHRHLYLKSVMQHRTQTSVPGTRAQQKQMGPGLRMTSASTTAFSASGKGAHKRSTVPAGSNLRIILRRHHRQEAAARGNRSGTKNVAMLSGLAVPVAPHRGTSTPAAAAQQRTLAGLRPRTPATPVTLLRLSAPGSGMRLAPQSVTMLHPSLHPTLHRFGAGLSGIGLSGVGLSGTDSMPPLLHRVAKMVMTTPANTVLKRASQRMPALVSSTSGPVPPAPGPSPLYRYGTQTTPATLVRSEVQASGKGLQHRLEQYFQTRLPAQLDAAIGARWHNALPDALQQVQAGVLHEFSHNRQARAGLQKVVKETLLTPALAKTLSDTLGLRVQAALKVQAVAEQYRQGVD